MNIKEKLLESGIAVDWSRIDELMEVLKPVQVLSKELQRKQKTPGDLVADLFECNYYLGKATKKGNHDATRMTECLDNRLKPIMETIQFEAAMFFDPRYVHQSVSQFTNQRLTQIIVSIYFLEFC